MEEISQTGQEVSNGASEDNPTPQQGTPISGYKASSKKPVNKKVIAFIIVLVIIVASISYALIDKSELKASNPNDSEFYDKYPVTPFDMRYITIETSTLLWGNFTHDYFLYNALLAVQNSPTIQNLSDDFKESYPVDVVQQAKVAYDYVTEEISPIEYIDTYESSYPVTTLMSKEAVCNGYASLLASLLCAEGLDDVALVFTTGEVEGIVYTHVYVAVKLLSVL